MAPMSCIIRSRAPAPVHSASAARPGCCLRAHLVVRQPPATSLLRARPRRGQGLRVACQASVHDHERRQEDGSSRDAGFFGAPQQVSAWACAKLGAAVLLALGMACTDRRAVASARTLPSRSSTDSQTLVVHRSSDQSGGSGRTWVASAVAAPLRLLDAALFGPDDAIPTGAAAAGAVQRADASSSSSTVGSSRTGGTARHSHLARSGNTSSKQKPPKPQRQQSMPAAAMPAAPAAPPAPAAAPSSPVQDVPAAPKHALAYAAIALSLFGIVFAVTTVAAATFTEAAAKRPQPSVTTAPGKVFDGKAVAGPYCLLPPRQLQPQQQQGGDRTALPPGWGPRTSELQPPPPPLAAEWQRVQGMMAAEAVMEAQAASGAAARAAAAAERAHMVLGTCRHGLAAARELDSAEASAAAARMAQASASVALLEAAEAEAEAQAAAAAAALAGRAKAAEAEAAAAATAGVADAADGSAADVAAAEQRTAAVEAAVLRADASAATAAGFATAAAGDAGDASEQCRVVMVPPGDGPAMPPELLQVVEAADASVLSMMHWGGVSGSSMPASEAAAGGQEAEEGQEVEVQVPEEGSGPAGRASSTGSATSAASAASAAGLAGLLDVIYAQQMAGAAATAVAQRLRALAAAGEQGKLRQQACALADALAAAHTQQMHSSAQATVGSALSLVAGSAPAEGAAAAPALDLCTPNPSWGDVLAERQASVGRSSSDSSSSTHPQLGVDPALLALALLPAVAQPSDSGATASISAAAGGGAVSLAAEVVMKAQAGAAAAQVGRHLRDMTEAQEAGEAARATLQRAAQLCLADALGAANTAQARAAGAAAVEAWQQRATGQLTSLAAAAAAPMLKGVGPSHLGVSDVALALALLAAAADGPAAGAGAGAATPPESGQGSGVEVEEDVPGAALPLVRAVVEQPAHEQVVPAAAGEAVAVSPSPDLSAKRTEVAARCRRIHQLLREERQLQQAAVTETICEPTCVSVQERVEPQEGVEQQQPACVSVQEGVEPAEEQQRQPGTAGGSTSAGTGAASPDAGPRARYAVAEMWSEMRVEADTARLLGAAAACIDQELEAASVCDINSGGSGSAQGAAAATAEQVQQVPSADGSEAWQAGMGFSTSVRPRRRRAARGQLVVRSRRAAPGGGYRSLAAALEVDSMDDAMRALLASAAARLDGEQEGATDSDKE